MSVSRITESGDWTFGKGKANLAFNSEEIRQNVVTRLKSFANDWFLDISANIDWFNILGNKNNEKTIRSEVTRIVLSTDGIATLDKFELIVDGREANIKIEFTSKKIPQVFMNKIVHVIYATISNLVFFEFC